MLSYVHNFFSDEMKLEKLDELKKSIWIGWTSLSYMFQNELLDSDAIDIVFKLILEKFDEVIKPEVRKNEKPNKR
jgi:hypothetical protein